MTNKQALESLTEYRNDNLFEKCLTEQGLTTSGTYSSANATAVDYALADVYLALANHPDFTEGELSVKYKPQWCIAMRRALYQRHGTLPPEERSAVPGITAYPHGSGVSARPAW